MMSFVEMTNDEWEEVRRHHDAMVQMGQLEMQSEEIREVPRAATASAKPVELELRDLSGIVANVAH